MIEVRDLVKIYDGNVAVDHISFTIEKGKIYGFLGPNGAGKTTTMNIITGCLAATEGQVFINGYDIFEDPKMAKRHMGYLPEQLPLYLDMTTHEYLLFAAELKGIAKRERMEEVAQAMERMQITDMRDRLIRHLSKGYRQRVGLAQTILGNPEIIILDEPTVGLDPKQIIEIREFIKSLGRDHTIILSSHILSEVSAICDYVLILSHGKLVASDTPERLSQLITDSRILSLTVRGSEALLKEALMGVDGAVLLETTPSEEPNAIDARIESRAKPDCREEIFYALAEHRCPLLHLSYCALSLEDVFLQLTSDEAGRPADPDSDGKEEEEHSHDSHL